VGDPAADYLLGLDSSYSQASDQKLGAYHYRQGEAYAQDDWKVTPRLTLNLGVRWQYFSNDTVSGDQVTSFNPNLYVASAAPVVNVNGTLTVNANNQPLTPDGSVANTLNGLAFAGQNGTPSGFFTPKKTNFGPRVGFAYRSTRRLRFAADTVSATRAFRWSRSTTRLGRIRRITTARIF
jgi:outer membrane receptor protein involved in Fe transport